MNFPFLLAALLIRVSFADQECLPNNNGVIPDCNCRPETVQYAVTSYLSPILTEISQTTFFRYFFVELDRTCPFWKDEGLCMMESCSVCTCPKNEIPKAWIGDPSDEEIGWVSSSSADDDTLGKISLTADKSEKGKKYDTKDYRAINTAQRSSAFFVNLYKTEDCDSFDEWTELHAPLSEVGVYVNLLQNPERFTGYAGPNARRVWKAIKEENCFGGADDTCLEKRIFYRMISGLQASISTHIGKMYLHPDGQWGPNLPLYWNAVGNHPDRLNNMYLAFLFLLRATMKAKHLLMAYPYDTGNATDDKRTRELITKLVNMSSSPVQPLLLSSFNPLEDSHRRAVEECSYGFDEKMLFQVSEDFKGPTYWQALEEKHMLREEFKYKFRNISRILDCVTCEKCRLWGKLQILGLGTAIKILLTNEEDLNIKQNMDVWNVNDNPSSFLNRQEIIALVNCLNQFSKSVEFSARALQLREAEERERLEAERTKSQPTETRDIPEPVPSSSLLIYLVGFVVLLVASLQCYFLVSNQLAYSRRV